MARLKTRIITVRPKEQNLDGVPLYMKLMEELNSKVKGGFEVIDAYTGRFKVKTDSVYQFKLCAGVLGLKTQEYIEA